MGLLRKTGAIQTKKDTPTNYLRLTKAMIQVLEQDYPDLSKELKKDINDVKGKLNECIEDSETGDILIAGNSAFLLGYKLAMLGSKISGPKIFDRETRKLSREHGKRAREIRWAEIDEKREKVLSLWDKQGRTKFKNSRKAFAAHCAAKSLLTERGVSRLLAKERPARKKP